MTIVDVQLLPILSYGCHLWDLKKLSLMKMFNMAFRNGIRLGMGMRRCECICDRYKDFVEAVERVKTIQCHFLQSGSFTVKSTYLLCPMRKLHHAVWCDSNISFILSYISPLNFHHKKLWLLEENHPLWQIQVTLLK